MSYEKNGFDPAISNNVVRVDGFYGDTAYIVDPTRVIKQVVETEGFNLFDNQKDTTNELFASRGSITYVDRDDDLLHIYDGVVKGLREGAVARDPIMKVLDNAKALDDGTTVRSRSLFSNSRIVSHDALGATYAITACEDSNDVGVKNDITLHSKGRDTQRTVVTPPIIGSQLILYMIQQDIRVHMLGYRAAIESNKSSRRKKLPALTHVLTPSGEMFMNPDTKEWKHRLGKQRIVAPAATSPIKQVKEQNPITTKASSVAEKSTVTLDDLAGLESQKVELRNFVEANKNPERAEKWGVSVPRSIILYGPSGTGKTTIAHAIANEIGAELNEYDFGTIVSKYLGETEKNLVTILDECAEISEPTVVLLDEVDGIFHKTSDSTSPSSAAANRLVAIAKTRIENLITNNPNVIIVAATNHIERIPEELIRNGRFGDKLYIDPPNMSGRMAILGRLISDKIVDLEVRDDSSNVVFTPFDDTLDIERLAKLSDGLVGADLEAAVSKTLLRKALDTNPLTKDKPISAGELEASVQEIIRQKSGVDTAL